MDSQQLFKRSCQVIPGGVNSPARAFGGVGGSPVFFTYANGARITDVENKRYIDYVCSWGAIITGHAHPLVIAAAQQAAANGLGFGAPTEIECRFAETLCVAMPSLQLVRCVNSGTEATMSAIRLARGWSGRDLLIKFNGGYHGHADSLLVNAGSGALTLGSPSSAGVPSDIAAHTLSLPYNDSQIITDTFAHYGDKIAAVIVEPIAGNMNMIRSAPEFLQTLRDLTHKHGAALIFDEVMSGFRVAAGGAQQIYNIYPDLTCLGKVIGGGLGVAAFGGRKDIMHHLAPLGDVYQAGTLSGNPVALAAGMATLNLILADGFFSALQQKANRLAQALTSAAARHNIKFCADAQGGMLGFYFCSTPPTNLDEIQASDISLFQKFFHAMLQRGVYLAPSAYEAGFISAAHSDDDIIATAIIAQESFAVINN